MLIRRLLFLFLFLVSAKVASAQLVVTVNNVKSSCGTSNNGSMDILVALPGTTGPYTLLVFGLGFGQIYNASLTPGVVHSVVGLRADTYLINVSDNDPGANFSTFTAIGSTTPITAIATTNGNNTDPTCGAPNGTITINSVTGGSGTFSYLWTGPSITGANQANQNLNNLTGGSYQVTVSDATANCQFTAPAIILTDPLPSVFAITSPDNVLCSGDPLSIDLSDTELNVVYTVLVGGSPTTTTLNGDGNPQTIVYNGPPALSNGNVVTVRAALNGSSCSPVTMTGSINVTVNTPPSSAALSLNGASPICAGQSTSLRVVITGGTSPFSITLDNGIGTINNYVSGTAIPVSPGSTTTYNMVGNVTDAAGCTVAGSGSATVTVNPSPTSAVLSGTASICSAGTANLLVTITGGTSPYTITLNNGVGTINNYVSGTAIPVSPGATTSYSLVGNVTDAAGCSVAGSGSATVTVNTPPSSAVLSGATTICSGASTNLTVTITGGTSPYSITLNNGVGTINNYVSGTAIPVSPGSTTTYSMVGSVTDAAGCTVAGSGSATVTVNPSPTSAVLGGTTAICTSGTANLSVTITGGTSPYSITLDNGIGTINNYVSGTAIPVSPGATTSYSLLGNVTDAVGCTVAGSGGAIVTVNTPPSSAVLSGSATICAAAGTNLTVTITGGTSPYSITLNNGVGTINNYVSGTPIPVSPGSTTTYSMVGNVTDAAGCTVAGSGSATVTVNPSPSSAVLSGTTSICSGGTANLSVTITGGTSPYSVTLDNGIGTINNYVSGTAIPVSPGATTSYNMVGNVTDALGCVVAGSGAATITVNTPPSSAVLSGSSTICSGGTTNLTVTITGGTGPYTIALNNGIGTINNYVSGTAIPVSPGSTTTYNMVGNVTDAAGCSVAGSGSATITVSPSPTSAVLSGTTAICTGGTANLSVTITGGTSPYSITLNNGVGTINNYISGTAIPVSPGATTTYNMVGNVTDAAGCTVAGSGGATVTINTPPASGVLSGTATICSGATTNLSVTITGGTSPYTVTLDNGIGTINNYVSGTAIPVSPGSTTTYNLVGVVTDAAGCTVAGSGTATVTVNPSPTSAALSGTTAICAGGTANLSVSITGGTSPYSITLNNGVGTINNYVSGTAIPVSPGVTTSYSMVGNVTDASGCIVAGSGGATVTVNAPPASAVVGGTITICSGNTANISVTITGGTSPYSITLDNGVGTINNYVSGTAIPVSPGSTTTYNLVGNVTDAAGCAVAGSGSATISVNPSPTSAVLNGTTAICSGGTANLSVTITGGTSPYSITLDNGVGTLNNYVSGTAIPVSPGATSSYSMVGNVIDALGCTVAGSGGATVTVNTPPASAVLSGTTAICSGGTANLTVIVTGGTSPYSITLNNGVGTINNYVSGTAIPVSPGATISYSMVGNVTDALGCMVAGSGAATVTVNTPPASGVLSGTATICSGTSANLSVTISGGTSPYSISLDNGIGTINNYVSGTAIPVSPGATTTYILVGNVTDAAGCAVAGSGSATVSVNPSPTSAVLNGTTAICSGGTANLSVTITGGTSPYSITLNNGVGTINNYMSGTAIPVSPVATTSYSMVGNVIDALGCTVAGSGGATVTVSAPPSSAVLSGTTAICTGGTANLSVTITGGTSPYSITLNNGVGTINNYISGTAIPVSPGATTTYNMVGNVTDAAGCTVAGSGGATVTVNTPPASGVLSGTATICSGASTNLSVTITGGTSPYSITLDNGVGTINNYVSGTAIPVSPGATTTYSLVGNVTDAAGCTVAGSGGATITVNPSPTSAVLGGTTAICSGGTANLAVTITGGTSPYSITLNNGVGTINNYVSGTAIPVAPGSTTAYNLVGNVTDALGCTVAGSGVATVTVHVPASSSTLAGAVTICAGQSTNLATTIVGGLAPFTLVYTDGTSNFTINGYTSGAAILVTPASTTTYSLVSVTDANSCLSQGLTGSPTVSVTSAATSAILSGTATICEGQTTNLSVAIVGGVGPFTVTYNDGTTNTVLNNYASGTLIPVSPATSVNYSLVSVVGSNACPAQAISGIAAVTVNPIPGDNSIFGADTWIAYVYNDGNITSPASVDFTAAKYRGFFTETELDAFGSSSYDLATDEFDLNLSNNIPAAGPNICGSYLNDYSIRFRMSKTMAAGVYTFTLGGDDGIRIFIDGAPVTLTRVSGSSPSNSFTDHAYALYTSNAVCLTAGTHDFVIEYYENGGFSRASFAYQAASAPTVSSPISACVNSSAPTLTASSTDPGVTGYNWYSDSGLTSLVASTQSYTPSATDLDMTVAGTSDFYVVTTFACGQSQPAQVDVTVISTASIAINPTPVQVCQSAAPFDLASVVTALPGGGTLTFGGTGVAGSNFDASQAIGSYPITVSYTAGGCSANSSFTVDIINTATITVPATDVTTCQSALPIDLTTLVSATPIGGSFVFSGAGVSGNDFDPSAQTGLVTITVDYSVGTCADTKTFNFNVVTSASLVTSNTVVCPTAGAVNLAGLVSASPSGGTFTFTGSPAITGNSLDPSLVAGSIVNVSVLYTVGGCSSTGNILVSVRTAGDPLCSGGGGTGSCATVVITPVPTPATCTLSDGSITFNINPAVPIVNNTGVKITIDGISTTNQTIARTNFNDPVFPNLPIGTYDYSIEYGDPSCIKTGQVTIDRSGTVGVPTLSNVVSPTCFGTATGSVTIDVPGETGNPLEWSLDGTTWISFVSGNQVTGVPAGDVIISVRRNSSDPCASGALLTMPAPVEIATTLTATAATCNNNDGAILVGTITGGTAPYTFEFNGTPIASLPTADTFTGLTAGTYTLRIKDALNCSKDFATTVVFPGFVNHTAPVGSALGCSPDGTNGTITFTISDPGTYLVGYTKDAVAEPTNYFDPLNPIVNISGLDNGNWYVWIKPASGSVCATKITTPIAIQGIVPVTFSDPASVDLNCASDLGSVLIQNVAGAPGLDYSYELVRGTDVITGTFTASQATGAVAVPDLAVGDYTIRVMQLQSSLNAACTTPITSAVKNFSVTSAPQLDMQLAIKDASCSNNDGSIIVESITGGVGPYTFELDGNPVLLSTANAIDGLTGNTYTLSVIDSKGCRRDYASLKIDFPGYIDITAPVGSSPSCLPNGSNGVISFQINQAGSYLVGYTTDLAAEPTNYFNPASQNVLIPGLANGNWFIWMKRSDGSGCVTKYPDPINIEGVYPVQAKSQASDISCFGDKASILLSDLAGAPGIDFTYTLTNSADNTTKTGSISFAQSLGEFRITDLTPGNYSLLLSQDQSSLVATCTSPILSESVLIDISGPSKALDTLYVVEKISLPDMATGSALIGLSPSGTEPYEASIELMEPILPGQSYFADWTAVNVNAQNLKFEKTFINLFAGVYELNIRDAAGCAKTYEVKIDVDTNISIPNIFTPNGDGVNDIFYIRNLPSEASLVITNRWGKEVFRSGSYQNDWSGGETADGVYFYKLSLPNDSITGWVEILRGK